MPVVSLHDYWWWFIFNLKYVHCATRSALKYSKSGDFDKHFKAIENWFAAPDFQRWSMVNNNNGMKIRSSLASYKYIQRQYICDFDKNDWYATFKTKLESLSNLFINSDLVNKTNTKGGRKFMYGLNRKRKPIMLQDENVWRYIRHYFSTAKIDW